MGGKYIPKKKTYPRLDKHCKGCVYYNNLGWCDYSEIEGKTRPCQGGEKCAVKRKGKKIVREADFAIFEGYDPGAYYY